MHVRLPHLPPPPQPPPTWLVLAIFLPAFITWFVLAFPSWVVTAAGALGRAAGGGGAGGSEAAQLVASASLFASLLRLASVLQWWLLQPASLGEGPGESQWVTLARLGLAVPLLATGGALKLGALRALGSTGIFFGRQLGVRNLSWCTSWPYDVTAHAWTSGSCLLVLGTFLLAREPPDGALAVLLCWLGAHLACVLLEEGLSSPFSPDTLHAPLPEGAHPFYDGSIREMSSAEHLRVVLMTPIAFLRALCFWGGIIMYGLFVNLVYYLVPSDAERRHAILVPTTKLAASAVLFCCGFTVNVRGRQNLAAAQRSCAERGSSFLIVSNHLSYVDILVCASIYGPYAAAARHDLLDWPIVGPVARAWGVVGVVQSSIRERELAKEGAAAATAAHAAVQAAGPPIGLGLGERSESGASRKSDISSSSVDSMLAGLDRGPPGTPGVSSAPPPSAAHASAGSGGGAAAVLSARARVPGSGTRLPPVLVFPEATCSVGGCLVTFRAGAFVAGVPVLPTALRYATPSGFNLSWVAPHSTGGHFLRSMCQWGKRCDVDILPLHAPTPSELENAAEFGEAVRGEMAAALGWPALSGWSVRDAHQLHHDLGAAQQSGERVNITTTLQRVGASGARVD